MNKIHRERFFGNSDSKEFPASWQNAVGVAIEGQNAILGRQEARREAFQMGSMHLQTTKVSSLSTNKTRGASIGTEALQT